MARGHNEESAPPTNHDMPRESIACFKVLSTAVISNWIASPMAFSPSMTGFEAAAVLRENEPAKGVRGPSYALGSRPGTQLYASWGLTVSSTRFRRL